jgi:diguanylate cyclase (GGDEF)-like protein
VIGLSGVAVGAVAAVSGGLHSPLAPLVSLWLYVAARHSSARDSSFAVGLVAAVLALMGATGGLRGSEVVLLVALVLAGAVPAAVVRRKPTAVVKPPAPAAPPVRDAASDRARIEELAQELALLAAHTLALRAVLWQVDRDSGSARQCAASGNDIAVAQIPVHGDPMGWVWQHGISLRVTPTPAWAGPGSIVIALRATDSPDDGKLVTLEFPAGCAPPALPALEGALGPLRRLLALQHEHTHVSADRRRLDTLMAALRHLPARLDLAGFANGVVDDAVRIAGATGGALGIWQREEGRIVAVADADGGPPVGGTYEPLESEMALAARGAAMLTREGGEAIGSRVAVATPADQWRRSPRSLAAIPLATPEGVNGVLAVWSSTSAHLEAEGLELLRTLAPLAASQLAHALEHDRLRENAERDSLTGLYNRRMFDHSVSAESARHERYGHPIALLLIDVDHFKHINDSFGHEAGDTVLRAVARVIMAGVRDVDVAARFGGEEFAVMLPETSPEAAADVAERLRASVERIELPWAGDVIGVRVSIGVSSCPACVRDPRALVRSADAALYQAKTTGRNRVIRAPATG